MIDRIQTRLTAPLAEHVARVVGKHGLFPTPSHYMQHLIRQDMENEKYQIYQKIVDGWRDIEAGRYFESTGDFEKDMAILQQKESEGWS